MPTKRGSMEGSYQFVDVTPGAPDAGRLFDVTVGKFGLDSTDSGASSS